MVGGSRSATLRLCGTAARQVDTPSASMQISEYPVRVSRRQIVGFGRPAIVPPTHLGPALLIAVAVASDPTPAPASASVTPIAMCFM